MPQTPAFPAAGAAGPGYWTDAKTIVERVRSRAIDVRDYGVTFDGVTDDTAAFQAAITDAEANDVRHFILAPGVMKVTSTIAISQRGMWFEGSGSGRQSTEKGTEIRYSGTGELFRIGTDDGNPYNSNNYDGLQGQRFEGLAIRHASPDTPLANGQGDYKAGAYAIRDWRGGDIVLRDVIIEHFEWGFWGIQSDFNYTERLETNYCRYGQYLGPRTAQNTQVQLKCLYNDYDLDIDRAEDVRFYAANFVGSGSTANNPIRIRSAWASVGTRGVVFHGCWFEKYQGETIEAFVEIGIGDAVTSNAVRFEGCSVRTNNQVTTPHAEYFVKMESATDVSLINNYQDISSLAALVRFVGTTSPDVLIISRSIPVTSNGGTGSPKIAFWAWGSAGAFSFGRAGAATGTIRLPNGVSLRTRNAADSADIETMSVSDTAITIGGVGSAAEIVLKGAGVQLDTHAQFSELAANPANPTSGAEANMYVKGDKLIVQYNHGGTVKYRYLDLTSTDATWTYTTSAP